jgi:hypothetical protein
MRFIVLLTAIAAPVLASAGEMTVTAQPVDHFRTIKPVAVETDNGLLIEGGYCRQSRFAARPQNVRIVKMDASGTGTDSETVRVHGAVGNRSQGCGYYAARAQWALSQGDKIEIQPIVKQ